MKTIDKIMESAEWTPDCQDKWDYDFPILSVSTRMWGNKGGILAFNTATKLFSEIINEESSAKVSFMVGEKTLFESDYIYGKTNEECKNNVEQWIKDNYNQAIELFSEKSREKTNE